MMKRLTLIAAAAMITTGCGGDDEKVRYITTPSDSQPEEQIENAALAAPRGVSHRSLEGSELLRWGAPDEETTATVAGYHIYVYDPSPERSDAFVRYSTSMVTANRVELSDLDSDEIYWFQVSAVDEEGVEGARSSSVRVAPSTGAHGHGLPTSDDPVEWDGSSGEEL